MMMTEDATTQTDDKFNDSSCCCYCCGMLLAAAAVAAVVVVVVESGRICEYIFFGRETRLKKLCGFTRTQHSDATTTTTAIFVKCQQ